MNPLVPLILLFPVSQLLTQHSPDLDSLCSAVVLAYLRSYSPSSKTNTLYIPLSNLPRADLALRPELLPVLKHANLKPSDLITLSDLTSSPHYLPVEQTKWILVDHNALTGELGKIYSSRVVGCIDHHDEEDAVPRDCEEEPRIVEKSGSCASLVVEYCKPIWKELAKTVGEDERQWNAELARLAIAPILIDTQNLRDEAKTVESDMRAVRFAEGWIMAGEEGESYSSQKYFEEIQNAKEDIRHLGLRDCLRKDYKEWSGGEGKVGVCSVVRDIEFLLEKAGNKEKFLEGVRNFAREKGLSVVSIMTTSHNDGVFKRELLVWALDANGVGAAQGFAKDSQERLGLEGWKGGELDDEEEGEWRRCWYQTKVENSRKQVAPLLRASLTSS
jgi:exopolyphosphatase